MIFTELASGQSVEGMNIPVFKTEVKSKKYIYLIAGTHGDEVEGVYVLKKIFDWLKSNSDLDDLPLIVIPILNIDGYKQGSRVNSHAVDLNRNYPTQDWSSEFKKKKYNPGPEALSEPENKFLNKLFQKYSPGFIMSFHTWKPILNYNGDCKDIADFLEQYNGYPVQPDIGYPTPGSLGSYATEKFNSPVLTFECPPISENKSLQEIWEENQKGLEEIFSSKEHLQKFY